MQASETRGQLEARIEPTRVMLVDDAPMWREALRADLAGVDGLLVVAEAADGQEAVERVPESLPDVILMDLKMPNMDGVEATRRILLDAPSVRILVLTQSAEEEDVVRALRAGAVGYLLKSVTSRELIDGIHRVARGEIIFTPELAGLVLAELRSPSAERPAPPLSERERLVLQSLAHGVSVSEIGQQFSISAGAVRNELRNIVLKLHRQWSPKIVPEERPGIRHPTLGAIQRRPSGARPPLPRDFSGAARFWIVMIAVLILAPALGLSGGGGNTALLHGFNHTIENLLQVTGDTVMVAGLRTIRLLGSWWTLDALGIALVLALVVFKRWQHLLAFVASIVLVGWIVTVSASSTSSVTWAARLATGQLVPTRSGAELAVMVVAVAYSVIPAGTRRRIALGIGGGLVVALGIAEIALGFASPSSFTAAAILGFAIPLLAFRIVAPESSFPVRYRGGTRAHLDVEGNRGEAIIGALRDQLGMTALTVTPFGLAGSGGSTPLRIRVSGDPDTDVFGKLYAVNHLRSDRLYKLGRMILYGSLEDEKPFNSVRRLVEYEDYILRLFATAGIPSAESYGFVELTPEREYVLITEFMEGAKEILDAAPDPRITRESLGIVRKLWDAGLAHRDIKPSNLLVTTDGVYLIDAAFCQVRPSPWRQAVDLANMMLVLGLTTEPEDVYAEAATMFTPEEIAEGFAATRSVTMPSQLRRAVEEDGRDLVHVFRRLAPSHPPISIQRWSMRRVAVTATAAGFTALAAIMVWDTLHWVGLR